MVLLLSCPSRDIGTTFEYARSALLPLIRFTHLTTSTGGFVLLLLISRNVCLLDMDLGFQVVI